MGDGRAYDTNAPTLALPSLTVGLLTQSSATK